MSQEFVYGILQTGFLLGLLVLRGNITAFPCGNLLPQHTQQCAAWQTTTAELQMGWPGGHFIWISITGYIYLACNTMTENGFCLLLF